MKLRAKRCKRCKELQKTIDGLSGMISCEERNGRSLHPNCAKDKSDPPGILLSRCLSCQLMMVRDSRDRLLQLAKALR